ncbi:transposase, partial [Chlorogloea sp. CCALA 695]|uniref:transposase n=1 Tax=Chlorogloea sp. CCALA 695 TaxID=2107693 RepID=UPI000D49085C
TNERIEIPVINERQKQTYYGALNLYTQRFLVKAYDKGDSQSTIAFLQYLRSQCPHRIALIWDGATYHRSGEVRTYLASVNQQLNELDWQITCIRFAPNAPAQNPALRCLVTRKEVHPRVLSSV